MKSLIVVFSYHHRNTEKIAQVFVRELSAQRVSPLQFDPAEVQKYDLVGFGSGIDSDKHYLPLLNFTEKLLLVVGKNAFIFSTCGNPFDEQKYAAKCHSALREKLVSKGYTIADEFICKGFNTNVFFKYFGGINKGKPDAQDLKSGKFCCEIKEILERIKYLRISLPKSVLGVKWG